MVTAEMQHDPMRACRYIKRQNVLAQKYRDPAKAMELRDVKPGQGL